jgi:hypothetical protein
MSPTGSSIPSYPKAGVVSCDHCDDADPIVYVQLYVHKSSDLSSVSKRFQQDKGITYFVYTEYVNCSQSCIFVCILVVLQKA